MVMPARVADAHRVADVLCGEDAAEVQPRLQLSRTANELRFEFLVRAFHPDMKKKTATSGRGTKGSPF